MKQSGMQTAELAAHFIMQHWLWVLLGKRTRYFFYQQFHQISPYLATENDFCMLFVAMVGAVLYWSSHFYYSTIYPFPLFPE
jgi:hypothetical protein